MDSFSYIPSPPPSPPARADNLYIILCKWATNCCAILCGGCQTLNPKSLETCCRSEAGHVHIRSAAGCLSGWPGLQAERQQLHSHIRSVVCAGTRIPPAHQCREIPLPFPLPLSLSPSPSHAPAPTSLTSYFSYSLNPINLSQAHVLYTSDPTALILFGALSLDMLLTRYLVRAGIRQERHRVGISHRRICKEERWRRSCC